MSSSNLTRKLSLETKILVQLCVLNTSILIELLKNLSVILTLLERLLKTKQCFVLYFQACNRLTTFTGSINQRPNIPIWNELLLYLSSRHDGTGVHMNFIYTLSSDLFLKEAWISWTFCEKGLNLNKFWSSERCLRHP